MRHALKQWLILLSHTGHFACLNHATKPHKLFSQQFNLSITQYSMNTIRSLQNALNALQHNIHKVMLNTLPNNTTNKEIDLLTDP